MADLSYWERRQAQQMFEYMEGAESTADEISKVYLKASRYLSHDMDKIFGRFRRKHGLSEAEARRLISTMQDPSSIEELKRMLRESSGDQDKAAILAELEAPAYQARLDNLQQKQNQIDLLMRDVYRQEKDFSTSYYVDLANESYYKSMFNIQQRAGYAFGFSVLDAEKVDRVLNSRWEGASYSERIWGNTQGLARTLKEEVLINLLTGRTDREAAEIIDNKFHSGASKARRLVRTEGCYVANELEAISYQECGIERYIYIATLDLQTCEEDCAPLDNKSFLLSKRKVGFTYPPMHPWCRCTTVAYVSEEDLARMQRWARDPVTGKTMYVPASMTYSEWYKKYVEGNPEAELQQRMTHNRSSDRTQHRRYQEIMGKDIPDRLDDFQQMKYTDTEKWKFMKLDVKRRNELLTHPEQKLPGADSAVLPDRKFSHYLFGGEHAEGLAKGAAITSRLGYDAKNWSTFQAEIKSKAGQYPAVPKLIDQYGTRYEQKMILYGRLGKPANVIVGWNVNHEGVASMASAYIKEV